MRNVLGRRRISDKNDTANTAQFWIVAQKIDHVTLGRVYVGGDIHRSTLFAPQVLLRGRD